MKCVVYTEIDAAISDYQPRKLNEMRIVVWLKTAQNIPRYSCILKVVGIRVPAKIRNLFCRAATGQISHSDLWAEYK